MTELAQWGERRTFYFELKKSKRTLLLTITSHFPNTDGKTKKSGCRIRPLDSSLWVLKSLVPERLIYSAPTASFWRSVRYRSLGRRSRERCCALLHLAGWIRALPLAFVTEDLVFTETLNIWDFVPSLLLSVSLFVFLPTKVRLYLNMSKRGFE